MSEVESQGLEMWTSEKGMENNERKIRVKYNRQMASEWGEDREEEDDG